MSTGEVEQGQGKVHSIRITNHGKIKRWVSFALEHLAKEEEGAIELHTLPMRTEGAGGGADERGEENGEKRQGMHAATATIPRLITVVEIIKREYLKTLDVRVAEDGVLTGLHQYNEIGELEPAEGGDEGRMEALARALQGRGHVKQKKTAFMRTTLCRKERPELVGRGATHQSPAVRRLSRTTRARLRKKRKPLDNI